MSSTEENDKTIEEEVENQEQEEDGSDILKLDFIEYEAPKIFIGNYPIDKSTIMTFSVGILLWIILYFKLGINKVECKLVKPFFIITIIFWILQIHDRRNEKLVHISLESASKHRARESTIVILSIIAIFTAFSWTRLPTQDQAILGTSLMALLFGSFWFTSADTSPSYRNVRNVHITSIYLGIFLFMTFVLKDMICPYFM